MANQIEILINAKDNASPAIDKTTISLSQLAKGIAAATGITFGLQQALTTIRQVTIGASLEFANEVEQLDRLRYVTGLNNEQLQVFRRGLERGGLEANQLGVAMRFFQNALVNSHEDMLKLGISSTDTFGALVQLKSALDAAGSETERTALLAATLGTRNIELGQTVTDVAANYDSEYSAALRAGAVMTEEMQTKMRGLDDAMDNFKDTVRSVKMELADLFGPVLAAALKVLNIINEHKDKLGNFLSPQIRFALDTFSLLSNAAGGGGATGALGPNGSLRGAPFPLPFSGPVNGFGAIQSTMGPTLERKADASELFTNLAKGLKEVEVPATQLVDTLARFTQGVEQAAMNIQFSFQNAIMSVVTGVQTIGQAFRSLIMNIFASIAEAIATYFAEQATGFLLSTLGGIVGGPVGMAIGGVGKTIRGSAMSGGGNTYVIQSISAKDALQSLVSPTGSLRGANDRVREVAMAGSL